MDVSNRPQSRVKFLTGTTVGTHAQVQSSCHWTEFRGDHILSRSTNLLRQACSWWAGLSEFPREGVSPAQLSLALGESFGGRNGAAFPCLDLAHWRFSWKQNQHLDGIQVNSTVSPQGHQQNGVFWKHKSMWFLQTKKKWKQS